MIVMSVEIFLVLFLQVPLIVKSFSDGRPANLCCAHFKSKVGNA